MTLQSVADRYVLQRATLAADIQRCQKFRHFCFYGSEGFDRDQHDPFCVHFFVRKDECIVGYCRVQVFSTGQEITKSYSAQFYDLNDFRAVKPTLLEVGRLCVSEGESYGIIVRLLWAAVARLVMARNTTFLFGCVSFKGVDPVPYSEAFAMLRRYSFGKEVHPRRKSQHAVSLLAGPCRNGLAQMPSLLRFYLSMGGSVSDHAVIDRDLNTLHVFTGLWVRDIPKVRLRAFQSLAERLEPFVAPQ